MKTILHYFSVYKKFIATSSAVNTSFRASFILLIFMDLLFYSTSISTVSFIYDHVAKIGPWNKDQLLFFITFMLTIDNIHMMIVSENFWEFSRQIRTGQLDYIILRPLSTIFNIFFRWFRPSSLVSFPIIVYFLITKGIMVKLTALDWCLLPFLLLSGLTLLILLELILSTSMFWIVEGLGINFLRMQVQTLGRWPDIVYTQIPKRILTTFIPILLVGSGPVHFLYDKTKWHPLLFMFIAIIISAFILKQVWKIGLKHYDSASS